MPKGKIRGFILDNFMFGASSQDLDDNASFLDTGIIDSTGVMELIGFLEEEFEITIEDTELIPDNLDSVNRVARFLEGKGVAVSSA